MSIGKPPPLRHKIIARDGAPMHADIGSKGNSTMYGERMGWLSLIPGPLFGVRRRIRGRLAGSVKASQTSTVLALSASVREAGGAGLSFLQRQPAGSMTRVTYAGPLAV